MVSDAWGLRLLDRAGRSVGTAFPVDDRHVLTCAHVVSGDGMAVVSGTRHVPTRVVFAASRDEASGRGDLAVLLLDEPVGVPVLPAALVGGLPGLPVRIFGQPVDRAYGVWAHGRVAGPVGPAAEWLRIDLPGGPGTVSPGFSGAPVIDTSSTRERVVGMLVGVAGRSAQMLPLQVVQRAWPLTGAGTGPAPSRYREQLAVAAPLLAQIIAAVVPMADQRVWDGLFERLGVADRSTAALTRTLCERPDAVNLVLEYVDAVDADSPQARELAAAAASIGTGRRPTLVVGDRALPVEPDNCDPGKHHLVCEAPAGVEVGTAFSVIAQITREPGGAGRQHSPLRLPPAGPDGGVPVTLVLSADGTLWIRGENEYTVTVPAAGDGPPVCFALRAETPGLRQVRVSAWAGGTPLATVTCQISVDVAQPAVPPRRVSAAIDAVRSRSGEVTLLVEPDGDRYAFRLLSPAFLSSRVLGPPLVGDAGAALAGTIDTLRKIILQEAGYTPNNAYRWVREAGVGLWQQLVPDLIKERFWQLHGDVAAFSIACADDRLPWELLYPLAPGHDEGFLVEQFPVLRQVADQEREPVMRLGPARYVVPPDPPVNAHAEITAVDRLLTAAGVDTVPVPVPALEDLLAVIDDGDTGLLHFACHNGFSLESGGSSIRMAGGAFVPDMLNSATVVRRLASRHPLVFINACHTARVAPYFTRMMGWAGQFMAAGAGAFVGTLWPVESRQASRYAETFYTALLAGRDLGAASLQARRAIRDPADPTWLAYTTYGDPNAVGVARMTSR